MPILWDHQRFSKVLKWQEMQQCVRYVYGARDRVAPSVLCFREQTSDSLRL
jgi:hypothetical protein